LFLRFGEDRRLAEEEQRKGRGRAEEEQRKSQLRVSLLLLLVFVAHSLECSFPCKRVRQRGRRKGK
jgi:hypothetical protein